MPSNDKDKNPPSSPKFPDLVAKFKDLERKQKEESEEERLSGRSPKKTPRELEPVKGSPKEKEKQPESKTKQDKNAMLSMAKGAGAVREKPVGISDALNHELQELLTRDKRKYIEKMIAEAKAKAIAKAKEIEQKALLDKKRKQESKGLAEEIPKELKYGRDPKGSGIVIEAGTHKLNDGSGRSVQFKFPILIDEKGSVFVVDVAHPLGEGSFGKVCVAVDINNPAKSNVVKIFPKGKADFSDKRLDREARKHLLNQSLVAFIQSEKEVFLIQERAHGISIEEYIKKMKRDLPDNKQEALTPQLAKPALMGVRAALAACEEMQRLHDMDIIHRDIKPANIMFDENTNKAKLIDLETSVHLKTAKMLERESRQKAKNPDQYRGIIKVKGREDEIIFYEPVEKMVGTMGYIAPEIAPMEREPVKSKPKDKDQPDFRFKKVAPNFQINVEKEWVMDGAYEGYYSKSSDKFALGGTIRDIFEPIIQLNDARLRAAGDAGKIILDLKKDILELCREPDRKVKKDQPPKPPSLMDEVPKNRPLIKEVLAKLKKHEEVLKKFVERLEATHPKLRT